MMYVCQIIMLYTLNLYCTIHRIYLNKIGRRIIRKKITAIETVNLSIPSNVSWWLSRISFLLFFFPFSLHLWVTTNQLSVTIDSSAFFKKFSIRGIIQYVLSLWVICLLLFSIIILRFTQLLHVSIVHSFFFAE